MSSSHRTLHLKAGEAGLLAAGSRFDCAYKMGIESSVIWCEGFLPDDLEESLVANEDGVKTNITTDMTALAEIGLRTGLGLSNELTILRDSIGVSLCRMQLWSARRSSDEQKMPHRILAAKQLIDENLGNEHLTLEAIAKRISVTPQHLTTAFRKATGLTPGRYLWRARANRARQMLIHSALPHSEISFQCGYKSIAHFSRSMRQTFGLPPGEIRRSEGYVQSNQYNVSLDL